MLRFHYLGCHVALIGFVVAGLVGFQALSAQELPVSTPGNPMVTTDEDSLSDEDIRLVRAVEQQRIQVIEQVVGSVIAVYGKDRQGGGSGVIIDPSGIALTNHHVIQGAGLSGLGGLNDGELYEWDLIGTDPGGDVAIIRMKGRDAFPWSPLGDSDKVKVGDWALAMGNPFLLAHDQVPTVTLGVVSGVERFQEGAGSNQLVYGNCIQIDSSINPGNSGGPLFNMQGEVIGINGRGSFRDRGRVNVGLGYAISSNQIRNFIPDLLATKIVEHGTLDANFSNREGKVVCSTLNLDAPVAEAGLELGDELMQFEGVPIRYANQFKNMICTLPEDWPATLAIRKPDGRELTITVRLFGLPYNFQPDEEDEGEENPGGEGEPEEPDQPRPTPDAAEALKDYLLKEPGVMTNAEINRQNLEAILEQWKQGIVQATAQPVAGVIEIVDEIVRGDDTIGQQTIWIDPVNGLFRIDHRIGEQTFVGLFDGDRFAGGSTDQDMKSLTLIEAKTNPVLMQAVALSATLTGNPPARFGVPQLDGGDKTQGRLSGRVMYLDDDEDWLYLWFQMFDSDGRSEVRLQKISAHRDCLGAGGLLLEDWRSFDPVQLPAKKHLVRGLDEQITWTALTREVRSLDSPPRDDLFSVDGDDSE